MKKRLFRLLVMVLLAVLVLQPVSASATADTVASGNAGALAWKLDEAGCLHITGSGAMPNYTSGSSTPWASYMKNIRSVVIGEGVTSVGNSAFSYYYNIETVEFPSTLTTIGENAFEMCSSLDEVELPDSVTSLGQYAFFQCDDLDRIVLSDNITALYSSTFFDCDALKEIVLPANLIFLGDTAINSCDSLKSITLPASLKSLGASPLANNISLENILVAEGNTAFKSVDGVLFSADGKLLHCYPAGRGGSYRIPDGTQTIVRGAFTGAKINEVSFADSVTSVEDSAFDSCAGLTEVDLNNVKTVADQAFQGCAGLTKITFGDQVSSIGAQLFYRATNLAVNVKEIFFTGNAPAFVQDMYGYYAFRNVNATAYYPANNSTWTSGKLQNYSGTITWVPYTPNATTASGTLSNGMTWSLDAEGTLTVTGTGAMPAFDTAPWHLVQDQIKCVVLITRDQWVEMNMRESE